MNAELDVQMRFQSMQFATSLHQGPNGYSPEALDDARAIYTFLKGDDPILDHEVSEDNVIDMIDYLEGIAASMGVRNKRQAALDSSNVVQMSDFIEYPNGEEDPQPDA